MRRTMIATLAAIALIAACNDASNKAEDAKMQNERRDEGANQPMGSPASVNALRAKDISVAGRMAGTAKTAPEADEESPIPGRRAQQRRVRHGDARAYDDHSHGQRVGAGGHARRWR